MIKTITLQGTPYERGLQYGAACKEEIRRSIESYKYLFGKKEITWEQAISRAERFIPAIKQADPCYIEEMNGIADGAALTFEDILVINCRSEILYAPAPQECTAFSLIPPATSEGKVLAGQNWDYLRSQREALVILRVPAEEKKPALLMFVEAGMIGGKGMNSAGLSLTLNALSTKESAYGLPLHIRMRRILEQRSMTTGYWAAVQGGHPAPVHFILTHRDGLTLGLEIDCSGIDVLQPKKGAHFHTNHFIGPKFSNRTHAGSSSTYTRLQRIEALLGDRREVTVNDIKAALADHAGFPSSICNHTTAADPQDYMKQHATNHGLIMDLTAGEAHFIFGNPCEGNYEIIKIEE